MIYQLCHILFKKKFFRRSFFWSAITKANLHLLIDRGRFRFLGLPIKIRGGTELPIRAVAVIEN
jgi:hypothetical protein